MKNYTLTKASLIALMAGSLISCSSTVDAFKPMPCDGVPIHHVTFTDKEKESITESVAAKVTKIMVIYKARIRAQCKAVDAHNKAHMQ